MSKFSIPSRQERQAESSPSRKSAPVKQRSSKRSSGSNYINQIANQTQAESSGPQPFVQAKCQSCQEAPCECGGKSIQTKLNVAAANHPLEREADKIADQVVSNRTNSATNQNNNLSSQISSVSPQSSGVALARENVGDNSGSGGDLSSQLASQKGRGSGLQASVKNHMESAFGTDFSAVRIHNDEQSAQLSRQLSARAFTHGNDVYFNRGQYRPGTRQGDHLIAHELTHVLQQQKGQSAGVFRSPDGSASSNLVQRDEDTSLGEDLYQAAQDALEGLRTINREAVDLVLPVGRGIYFESAGGITWGIPIHTGGEVTYYLRRISETQLHLKVYKKGKLGLDVGVGAGAYAGTANNAARGTQGAGIGAVAGANFELGVAGVAIEEYVFPIDTLLSFAAGGVAGLSGSNAFSSTISHILDRYHEQYQTHQRVELQAYMVAAAEASAGVNRPGERYQGGQGERVRDTVAWGPGGDRESLSSRPRVWDGDPLSLLNSLRLSAGIAIRANLAAGYDQQRSGQRIISKLYLEGQFSVMVNLPIPGINQILQMLPMGAGGGIELSFTQEPGTETKIQIAVYVKNGEDQLYQGPAHQETFTFDVTGLMSVDDIMQSLASGTIPSSLSLGNMQNAFESVNFWNRFSLLSPMGLNFNIFMRRQRGVRSLLSDRMQARARDLGFTFIPYLTLGLDMTGPNFIEIAQDIWRVAQRAGSTAAQAAGPNYDLVATYGALERFFGSYTRSEEFDSLLDKLLDYAQVNTAELLLQYGVGIGVSGKLGAGAKIRGDISVGAGMFCSVDYLAAIGSGGKITLRQLMESFHDLMENPLNYMPNCPLLEALFSNGGGGGSGNGNGNSGPRSGTINGGAGGGDSGSPGDGGRQQRGSRSAQRSRTARGGTSSAQSGLSNNRRMPDNVSEFDFNMIPVRINGRPITTLAQLQALTAGQTYQVQLRMVSTRVRDTGDTFTFRNLLITIPITVSENTGEADTVNLKLRLNRDWWVPIERLQWRGVEGNTEHLTRGVGSRAGVEYTIRN